MIERQQNWLGQQRVDVPHLRSLESSVAHDFDVLAGKMLAGEKALVLKGFNLTTNGVVGAPATSLQLNVAGGMIVHYGGSEAGSMLSVAEGTAAETLSSANPILSGSFASSSTNYLGLDLTRSADDTTSDSVQFLGAGSTAEVSRIVPLARTLKYKLVLSTQSFTSRPTILPLAKIVTDASNTVVSIEDARQLMFRLGAGGDRPDSQNSYNWAQSRTESYLGDVFSGGDKTIGSMKDWMDAAMARIQEIGGGEFWFSATADRNVNLTWHGPAQNNGEHFLWTSGSLKWAGLHFVFDNSTSYINVVKDVNTVVAGLNDLATGECIYVDLDRTKFCAPDWINTTLYIVGSVAVNNNLAYECITGGTSAGSGGPTGTASDITDGTVHWRYLGVGGPALVPVKTTISALGPSSVPGARHVIAWRLGDNVYTREWPYPVGTTFTPATSLALGVVKLSRDVPNPEDFLPVVISDQGGTIDATRSTAPASAASVGLSMAGLYFGGFSEGEAPTGTLPTTPSGPTWATTHIGHVGHSSSASGYGLLGYTTHTNGYAGVLGLTSGITLAFPTASRWGVMGIGYDGGGLFYGGAGNSDGVAGYGIGSGFGGRFTGGSSNGGGVSGYGTGTGSGGYFEGGGSGTTGLAVEALGSVQVANGFDYKYSAAQSFYAFATPVDIILSKPLSASLVRTVTSGANPYLSCDSSDLFTGWVRVNVPAGATITAADISSVSATSVRTINSVDVGVGGDDTTAIGTNFCTSGASFDAPTTLAWTSVYAGSGSWTDKTVPVGGGCVWVRFTTTECSTQLKIYGIRVTYTMVNVKPST